MQKLTDLQYLQLNWFGKLGYNLKKFVCGIPGWFARLFIGIWNAIKKFVLGIWNDLKDIGRTFVKGSWVTKVSFLIMGFGSIARGQILRGALFFIFEAAFVLYMIFFGAYWLGKFDNLGDVATGEVYDPELDMYINVQGDDSFKIMLYSVITIFFIIAFIYTWRLNVKQNRISEEILATGKKLKSGKQDLRSMVDDDFHKTLLALPLTGIVMFTVMPIIFMVLIAFTNYDGAHNGYNNLFTWVGLDNFNQLFITTGAGGNLGYTFGEILSWTLIWAFFATFTNYFLGMFVAMMINKKGIKIKKFWRGVLVLTIAIPQFVSLLYVSRLFGDSGIIKTMLYNWGLVPRNFSFWGNPTIARILVIVINIWIGIPHMMLIVTGILMNIPADLYESAKIDGANVFQQFTKITFPYMLFVTGPYLLTSFIGNINNFNVIFLLTNGQAPTNPDLLVGGTVASDVDLLITWLFNITNGADRNYKLAAVVGILIFVVIATLSLIVYNVMPSTKNEEDFQ